MAKEEMPIGAITRQLRRERGMSLTALARKAGISKAYLSQLENDPSKKPSAEVVLQLARALDVPVTQLMGLEDDGLDRNTLPPALRIFWGEYPELPPEDIKVLAQIEYQGMRPFTPTDYWLIYETIRLAATRHVPPAGEETKP